MVSGLLSSFAALADNVVTIVTTPVKLTVDAARIITGPAAEAAKDVGDLMDEEDTK